MKHLKKAYIGLDLHAPQACLGHNPRRNLWTLQGKKIRLQIRLWQKLAFVKVSFGLERIGGLRELEDLRGFFIISLRVQKMSGS
jgi:hypothetical protein